MLPCEQPIPSKHACSEQFSAKRLTGSVGSGLFGSVAGVGGIHKAQFQELLVGSLPQVAGGLLAANNLNEEGNGKFRLVLRPVYKPQLIGGFIPQLGGFQSFAPLGFGNAVVNP